MSNCDPIRPDCAASLAVLQNKQQTMNTDITDLKKETKKIREQVTRTNVQIDTFVIPFISEMVQNKSWFTKFIQHNLTKAILLILIAALTAVGTIFLKGR